jgi:hypothetical protein
MTVAAGTSGEVRDRPADFSDRVVDLFISFLRELYKHRDDFTYDDDDRITKIMVFDKYAINMDAVAQKPALVTDLKPISKQDVSMDDRAGVRHPDFNKGSEYRTTLFNATLLIHAVSSIQWESRHLAFLTGMGITGFEPEIRRQGIITDVNVVTPIGEPVKLVTSSRAEIWSTPTTVQVAFEETWVRSIIKSELLEKICPDIRVKC